MDEVKLPKVIFFFGLPGSGKTFLAHHLSLATGLKHISSDVIRRAYFKRGQYRLEDKEEVYVQMQIQMSETLQNGKSVIVDATFFSQKLRNEFISIAQYYTNNLLWILTTAEEKTIKKRVSKKRKNSEADFEVYKLIRDLFDPIEMDFLEIKTDKNILEENLKSLLNYCELKNDNISS